MKKINLSFSMILFFLFINYSYGFAESRHQWWEVRLQKLAAEKNRLQKNNTLDPQVPGLIDNEMKRARDILDVIESGMNNDGFPTHEEQVIKEARMGTEDAYDKNRESLREKIARIEIDTHYRHIIECADLFEKFRYGEDVLSRFAEKFATIMKESRTGMVSPALEYTVKNNSLLTSPDDFDRVRMNRESATKKYVRKEAKIGISRLNALIRFYKKNGVDIKDKPSTANIAALESRLNTCPRVQIDAWVMNEDNVAEIDKKVVKKLSLILNRQAYYSKTISVQNPEFSLSLPRGWEEDTVGQMDSYRGIVKSFHNKDGNSSIKLVTLALDSDDVKKAAEEWVQKAGCSLVEKRWDKVNDLPFLWILAKDKDRNVSETCSVSKDGYALIITGKTSRDRYAKFKMQFRKIINSLQAGKI